MSSSQKDVGALRINPNVILVLQPTLIIVLSDQGEAVVEKEIPPIVHQPRSSHGAKDMGGESSGDDQEKATTLG